MLKTLQIELTEELFAIEQGFWLKGQNHFLEHLDEDCLLAFPQMGELHGVKSREAIAVTAATNEGRWRDLKVGTRHLHRPSDLIAIISYRADVTRGDGEPYSALVSSAYVRRADGWKLTFHQHSPLEK